MADEDLIGIEATDFLGGRGGDAKDHVGTPRNLALDDLGTGIAVLGVGMAGCLAGTALDQNRDLLVGGEGFNDVRDQRDPALSLDGLFRHSDFHAARKVM